VRGLRGPAPEAPPFRMLRTLAAALALAALAHADEVEDAGRLFSDRCVKCHTLPDRDLAGDRAWLGQVPRTA